MEIHIHLHHHSDPGVIHKLDYIIKQNKDMAKDFSNLQSEITTLSEKADRLQSSLDTEQAQISTALATLQSANDEQTALIETLRAELAALGADQAKIDELATLAESANTKIESAIADLENTIPTPPADPNPDA